MDRSSLEHWGGLPSGSELHLYLCLPLLQAALVSRPLAGGGRDRGDEGRHSGGPGGRSPNCQKGRARCDLGRLLGVWNRGSGPRNGRGPAPRRQNGREGEGRQLRCVYRGLQVRLAPGKLRAVARAVTPVAKGLWITRRTGGTVDDALLWSS
jgi:hypothetical protein